MGATKRLSEMLFQAASLNFNQISTTVVRFGNVVGSTGSVIPLFQEQISKKLPVTVTHPEVTRYLMTIPNATNLVMQSNILSDLDNENNIYIFRYGQAN